MNVRDARHQVKVAIAHLLYGLGLLQWWRRRVFRERAVVLMYHRVLDDEARRRTDAHFGMVVARETFARQMALLKTWCTPLSLAQFAAHLREQRPFPDGACLVTFDDGWTDNLEHAMPVLRREGIPAAIFLPVGFIGTRRQFTREAFTHLVLRARDTSATTAAQAGAVRAVLASAAWDHLLDIGGSDPRPAVIAAIGEAPVDRTIEALVPALSAALDLRVEDLDTPDTFMTWEQVDGLATSGVTFGAHGAEHKRLATLPPAECDADVQRSKDVLAARLTPDVWGFAYPNGSCNESVAATVATHGFDVAFTTVPGTVSCTDPRMMVKRVNIHEDMTDSAPMFLARLVGLF